MSMETDAAVDQLEVGGRDSSVEHVLVNVITRTCVDKKDIVHHVAVRQVTQPVKAFLADHVDGPPHDGASVVIEPFEDLRVGTRPVMVADKRQPAPFSYLVDAPLGVPRHSRRHLQGTASRPPAGSRAGPPPTPASWRGCPKRLQLSSRLLV